MGKVTTERDRLGSPRCLLNDYHQYLLNIALITPEMCINANLNVFLTF